MIPTDADSLRSAVLRVSLEILADGQGITLQRLRMGGVLGTKRAIQTMRRDLIASGDLPREAIYDHAIGAASEERRLAKEDRTRAYVAAREKHDATYLDYLESPEWATIRRKVLKRDGYLCQGCLEKPGTIVHHLTYKRQGNEMACDLISLCKDCHDRIHGRIKETTKWQYALTDNYGDTKR